MTIYTLYKKTHRKTGLNYLGYTGSKDPYKYKGSGSYWLNHIKLHQYDVATEILFQTTNLIEIKDVGLYYSDLWNIVESKEWANLKPESGEAGWPVGPSFNKKMLAEGRHPSQKFGFKEQQRIDAYKRVKNGTHNFLDSNFHKHRIEKGNHPSQTKLNCSYCNKLFSLNGIKQHAAACHQKHS